MFEEMNLFTDNTKLACQVTIWFRGGHKTEAGIKFMENKLSSNYIKTRRSVELFWHVTCDRDELQRPEWYLLQKSNLIPITQCSAHCPSFNAVTTSSSYKVSTVGRLGLIFSTLYFPTLKRNKLYYYFMPSHCTCKYAVVISGSCRRSKSRKLYNISSE